MIERGVEDLFGRLVRVDLDGRQTRLPLRRRLRANVVETFAVCFSPQIVRGIFRTDKTDADTQRDRLILYITEMQQRMRAVRRDGRCVRVPFGSAVDGQTVVRFSSSTVTDPSMGSSAGRPDVASNQSTASLADVNVYRCTPVCAAAVISHRHPAVGSDTA